MKQSKTFLSFALFLVALSAAAIVNPATAETGTYRIQPHQQKIVSINLNAGDKVSGTLVVNGEGTVDFWVSDPQSLNVTAYSNVGQKSFSLTTESSGVFVFHIFNEGASEASVTFNYNLSRQIFGMPQEMFLLLVIVGVILLLIVVWALLSKV